MPKDDEKGKGEGNDQGETFDDGFKEAEVKAVDEFADKTAETKPVEAKTATVVTEKPAETKAEVKTEAKPKPKIEKPEPATEPEDQEFLTEDELSQLSEAEKQTPGISKIVQRTKSWRGRLKKAHSDLVAAQTQLAQQESNESDEAEPAAPAPAGEAKPAAKPAAPALSDEEKQTVEELASEYPVIDKGMDIKARKIAQEIVDERLGPVEEAVAARDRASSENHFQEVADSHEDFYELARGGALDDWIDTLPHLEAKQLEVIRDRGSTSQVIALLDRFKKESGYQEPASKTTEAPETAGNGKDKDKPKVSEAQQAKRKAALAASEAVPRHSGGPPAAAPDDTDFDAGFNESSKRPDE